MKLVWEKALKAPVSEYKKVMMISALHVNKEDTL
jgi:hypothetical protein